MTIDGGLTVNAGSLTMMGSASLECGESLDVSASTTSFWGNVMIDGNLTLSSESVISAPLANSSVVGGAGGIIADGTITGADIQNSSVSHDDVNIVYARGIGKGGAAADLTCTPAPCVSETEVDFNFAGADSPGGAATDLACPTSCVSGSEIADGTIVEDDLEPTMFNSLSRVTSGGGKTCAYHDGDTYYWGCEIDKVWGFAHCIPTQFGMALVCDDPSAVQVVVRLEIGGQCGPGSGTISWVVCTSVSL